MPTITKDGWTITGDTPRDIELGVLALASVQKETQRVERCVSTEMLSPRECAKPESPGVTQGSEHEVMLATKDEAPHAEVIVAALPHGPQLESE